MKGRILEKIWLDWTRFRMEVAEIKSLSQERLNISAEEWLKKWETEGSVAEKGNANKSHFDDGMTWCCLDQHNFITQVIYLFWLISCKFNFILPYAEIFCALFMSNKQSAWRCMLWRYEQKIYFTCSTDFNESFIETYNNHFSI